MPETPPVPPEPALKDFLDEVVVPILVARFLREHAAHAAERAREESLTGSEHRDGENVAAGLSRS